MHRLLADARFYALLLEIDWDLARSVRDARCECAGALHASHYPRKPRGGPAALPEGYERRYSFCCSREGCRTRATPPSVRFFGRRWYLAGPSGRARLGAPARSERPPAGQSPQVAGRPREPANRRAVASLVVGDLHSEPVLDGAPRGVRPAGRGVAFAADPARSLRGRRPGSSGRRTPLPEPHNDRLLGALAGGRGAAVETRRVWPGRR